MTDWQAVITEHGPKVWRTVYRLLANHADALDCYQETFLSAHRAGPVQPVLDWGGYLTTLAARRAIDRLRERGQSRALVTSLEHTVESAGREPDPVEQAAATELMDRVRRALTELPDRQAEVLWMSCVEGFAHDRIAELLRITPGAVRVLLHRARTGLAAGLATATPERTNP